MIVEIDETNSELMQLIARVEAGEEVVLSRGAREVAKLVPIAIKRAAPGVRGYGAWKGRFELPDSSFDPLPEDELRAWEGEHRASD